MSLVITKEIADLKKKLLGELDKLFGYFEMSSFAQVAPLIEGFVEDYVSTAIFDKAHLLAPETRVLGNDAYLEVVGVRVRVGVAIDIWKTSILQVVLLPDEDAPSKRPRSRRIAIEGVGRVRNVRLMIAPSLAIRTEVVEQLTKTILETGYAWLEERFRQVLNAERECMAEDIYSHLRKILPDKEIWSRVWFWSYVDGEGAYLADPMLSQSKLPAIRDHPLSEGKSPVEILVTALTTLSLLKESFTRDAVQAPEPVTVDLRGAAYVEEEPLYVVSERLLFGGSSLTIYPIVKEGRALFLVGFPSQLRSELIPVFAQHSDEFAQIFRATRSKVHRLLRSFTKGPQRKLPQVAEAAGRFIRGFLGID